MKRRKGYVILRKDGVKQRYPTAKIKNLKRKGYVYDRHERAWVKRIYRLSMVWMFYKTEERRYTPDPFLELRAYCYTYNPKKWKWEQFNQTLFDMSRKLGTETESGKFYSIQYSWKAGNIYLGDIDGNEIKAEVVGLEKEWVDRDEVENDKEKGRLRFGLDKIHRYACFFKKGKIAYEYGEPFPKLLKRTKWKETWYKGTYVKAE